MRLKPFPLPTAAFLPVLFGMLAMSLQTGCTGGSKNHDHTPVAKQSTPEGTKVSTRNQEDADIKAERAKLSPEDQRLVAAQEFCPIQPEERLGSMGLPIKVIIMDQPVFLCCKGCKKDALAKPEQTLAKVEELKAKVKAGTSK